MLGRRFAASVYNLFIGAIIYPVALLIFAIAMAMAFANTLDKLSGLIPRAIILAGPALLAAAVAALFSRRGRMTPGGKLVGLAVVDRQGTDIKYWPAYLRYLLYTVSLLPLGLGIWWAAIDKDGRTWPDIAQGTKVVYRGEGAPALPVSVVGLYGLGLAVFACGLFGMLNLFGLFSFFEAILTWLVAGILGSVLLVVAAVVIRIAYRKEPNIGRVAGGAFPIAGLSFLAAVLAAATIPSNGNFMKMNWERQCVEELRKTGPSVERFVAEKGRQPKDWEELILSGYIQAVPEGGHKQFVLGFEATGQGTVFVIEHPEPGQLMMPQGFGPAKKCKGLRYRQGKGVEVDR